jgi:hypothetical protein
MRYPHLKIDGKYSVFSVYKSYGNFSKRYAGLSRGNK